MTAPIAIRERVAFAPDQLTQALASLVKSRPVHEAAIISTCNRTELICETDSPEQAADWLADYHNLPLSEISPFLYAHPDQAAVRHVLRVASGLDSMVLGETQILGQMKDAVRMAESAGTLGGTLHKLFQHSFTVAKQVRSQTNIGANVVSMAAAAVELSSRIFERISERRVLFIGAGQMIGLCVAHFAGANPRSITIANRTSARAQDLAKRVNADVMTLSELGERLHQFDIIVSCTASPLPVLGRGVVERAIRARRHQPMVMVDLAVPRDIEPEVKEISDVFLYTVDDLSQIVQGGKAARQDAADDAQVIIDQGVEQFLHWVEQRSVVPTIRRLRDHAESLRQEQLDRALRQLARGEAPEQVLQALSQGLVNKLLHAPLHYLNHTPGHATGQAIETAHQFFNLDASSSNESAQNNQ